MFFPYHSSIFCQRQEPRPDFDIKRASARVERKFAELAEKIVVKSWLKNPKKTKSHAERIKRAVEFDERLKLTKNFMTIWNKWRRFYFDLNPIEPRNSSQLTSIDNAIAFASEHDLDLNILIASVHRGYLYRKFRPGFNAITSEGAEYYEKHFDDVMADIDKKDYEENADS